MFVYLLLFALKSLVQLINCVLKIEELFLMDLQKTSFFLLKLGGMGYNADIDDFRYHISKRIVQCFTSKLMFFNNFVAQLHSLVNLCFHFCFISFQLINLYIDFLPMLVLKLGLYALSIFIHLGLHGSVFYVIGVDGQLGNHSFQLLVFLHYLCYAVPHIISLFLK